MTIYIFHHFLLTLKRSYAILGAVIKMLESKGFNIKEISSVALIQPKENEERIIHYGNKTSRYQLIYKLSGEVITHFNNKVFHIKPDEAYIIPKSQNADYYIERTIPGDCIDIFFDTDASLGENLFLLDFGDNIKILNLFQRVYRLWILKSDGYYFKCMAAVYEILYEMLLKSEQYSSKSKLKKLEAGLDYIHSNLYGEIDYNLPSKMCGISYTYFKKLFIERFGVPPVQYVNNMRLERSAELLLTDKYSIGEIAKMCGFENVYYFSKKFKEKYLCPPTLYNRSQRDRPYRI